VSERHHGVGGDQGETVMWIAAVFVSSRKRKTSLPELTEGQSETVHSEKKDADRGDTGVLLATENRRKGREKLT